MKISNSKEELARIISENGGWKDKKAEWSAQDGSGGQVSFFKIKAPTYSKPEKEWMAFGDSVHCYDSRIEGCKVIKNFHQTILSREEYFHIYPAPDADGWIAFNGKNRPEFGDEVVEVMMRDGAVSELGPQQVDHWDWITDGSLGDIIAYRLHKPEQAKPEFCESVMRSIPEQEAKPTIEQLAADYRNAKDYANRKQDEADKANMQSDAALSQLEDAIAAIGFAITPLAATEKEPELVITDWRDLQVGDVVEGHHYGRMVVGEVCEIDEECHDNRPFRIHEDGGNPWWVTSKEFKFISRP